MRTKTNPSQHFALYLLLFSKRWFCRKLYVVSRKKNFRMTWAVLFSLEDAVQICCGSHIYYSSLYVRFGISWISSLSIIVGMRKEAAIIYCFLWILSTLKNERCLVSMWPILISMKNKRRWPTMYSSYIYWRSGYTKNYVKDDLHIICFYIY